MRKQYFFRQSPRGLLAWDVDRLVDLTRDLPVQSVRLTEIRSAYCRTVRRPAK